MRVLFDQATPLPIAPYLGGHSVLTAAQQGWATLGNGDLLKVAEEAGFDVLLTTDKNMRYQQNLAGRKIAIVVLETAIRDLMFVAVVVLAGVTSRLSPGFVTWFICHLVYLVSPGLSCVTWFIYIMVMKNFH
jgi:hypothetical protein